MRIWMGLTVGIMMISAELASANPIDGRIDSVGFHGLLGSGWRVNGATADRRLLFEWRPGQPDAWNQHWRPTIDCPALCATANLGLQLVNPLTGLMRADYDGIPYGLPENGLGNRITSLVLTIAGSPAVPGVLTEEINVEGGYTSHWASYFEIVPFALSITLHNGTLGTDVTIEMAGMARVFGNAQYSTQTSTGAILNWEEAVAVLPVPVSSSPEPSTLAMWLVGGTAIAVGGLAHRRRRIHR